MGIITCNHCGASCHEFEFLDHAKDCPGDRGQTIKRLTAENATLREFRRRVQTALEHCTTYDLESEVEAALFELLEWEE